MLLKRLICNILTLVAHQGFIVSKAGLSLCKNLQFLTSVNKHSQRFSFTNGERNCPEEGETSSLSLSGIRECKYTTNKFLLEHNGGLGRQEDEMRKEDGGRKTKVDAGPVHQLVSKRISCTWSLALEFSNCNIKCHQGNSDNGLGKKRVKGRGGGEKWGLKSTMANKSHQMTMPDSHFNSEMMPLSCCAPKYWFFFSSLGVQKGKKMNPVETDPRCWHQTHG